MLFRKTLRKTRILILYCGQHIAVLLHRLLESFWYGYRELAIASYVAVKLGEDPCKIPAPRERVDYAVKLGVKLLQTLGVTLGKIEFRELAGLAKP